MEGGTRLTEYPGAASHKVASPASGLHRNPTPAHREPGLCCVLRTPQHGVIPTIAGTSSAGEARREHRYGVSPARSQPAARAAAARPRWCTAEAPPPRPAYNGAAEAYPGIARRAWWRLFCLLWHRGRIEDPWARRMARHLARVADTQGMITGLPDVMRSYAAREHVSVQTGYHDLRRLVLCGLVRQIQAAAPGYPARYRLSAPTTEIPADLPADLARAIHGPSGPSGADRDAQSGSGDPAQARDAEPDEASCGGLDTSPLPYEGSPPSPCSADPGGSSHRRQHRARGQIGSDERDHARAVLAASAGEWRAQRGRAPVPGCAELARVEAMTALALRHVPRGEVVQLLTERVASARDLPGMLAWRLGQALTAARRDLSRQVLADEDGVRYAAWLSGRGNTPGPAARAAIATARAELEAIQRRRAAEGRAVIDHLPCLSTTDETAPTDEELPK